MAGEEVKGMEAIGYNSYRCEDKRPLNPADVVGLRIGENVYPLTLE